MAWGILAVGLSGCLHQPRDHSAEFQILPGAPCTSSDGKEIALTDPESIKSNETQFIIERGTDVDPEHADSFVALISDVNQFIDGALLPVPYVRARICSTVESLSTATMEPMPRLDVGVRFKLADGSTPELRTDLLSVQHYGKALFVLNGMGLSSEWARVVDISFRLAETKHLRLQLEERLPSVAKRRDKEAVEETLAGLEGEQDYLEGLLHASPHYQLSAPYAELFC